MFSEEVREALAATDAGPCTRYFKLGHQMTGPAGMVRQVSIERFFADNEARLGLSWLAGARAATAC
jgi:hypothetical protein